MTPSATSAMSPGISPAAVQRRRPWLQRSTAALSVTSRAACVASRGISAATAWRPSSVTPVAGGATWPMSARRPGCLTVVSAGSDNRCLAYVSPWTWMVMVPEFPSCLDSSVDNAETFSCGTYSCSLDVVVKWFLVAMYSAELGREKVVYINCCG